VGVEAQGESVVVGGEEAPVLPIPEDDVTRDYKVAVEREALEAAALEVIPPEFMIEEDERPQPPPRPRPRRPRRPRKWYEEIFGDEYLRSQPTLSGFQYRREIEFVEKGLGLRPGAMVLDLACGSGLHSIGLCRKGYQVVGMDLSVAMLAIAGEEAQEQDLKINFLHGDMRDLKFGPTFDGAFCIGSSFGYFDEENNQKVIEGVREALKPGGIFMLEVENRDFVMRSQPNLLWYEGDGFITMEETSFDFITSRLTVNRTMLMDEGGKKVFKYTMRVYSLHELGTMLHNAGFSVFQVGGHRAAPRAFFGEESPKIIICCKKRAEEG
jgi:SAM-dependent methyltransferase